LKSHRSYLSLVRCAFARHLEGRVLPAVRCHFHLPEATGEIDRLEHLGLADLVDALPHLLGAVPVGHGLVVNLLIVDNTS
jgi:hypothetical protein